MCSVSVSALWPDAVERLKRIAQEKRELQARRVVAQQGKQPVAASDGDGDDLSDDEAEEDVSDWRAKKLY